MKMLGVMLAGLTVMVLIVLSPAANAQGTGPAAVVQTFETAFNNANVDAALDTFADNATLRPSSGDVYSGKGLIRSWITARTQVDKIRYDKVGDYKVDGNKVSWEVKPSTGANLLANATVENGKITLLTYAQPPAATATPAAAAAQGTPAAGAATQGTPQPAATATAVMPSALPTTGQTNPFLPMGLMLAVGLLAVGLGLALRRAR